MPPGLAPLWGELQSLKLLFGSSNFGRLALHPHLKYGTKSMAWYQTVSVVLVLIEFTDVHHRLQTRIATLVIAYIFR